MTGVWTAGTPYTFQLYVNGVLDTGGTLVTSNTLTPNVLHPQIGTRGDNVGHFKGTMDEVRVYNRALTQAQVQHKRRCNCFIKPAR